MSAQPAPERKFYTDEERASFRAWRFGSTLDWASLLLTEINYPVELRWFVDAVQGLCKGREMRIAHSTLAKRAQRFKNKPQASDLTRRAIDANNEWARARRCMVFDIERPKPGEMEGKEKRARTRYTDYLTPAIVWAQEMERVVKKADEVTWKRDTKYRLAKRREIMDEALKMLPGFKRAEDMPGDGAADEKAPLSLREYILQRERIALAEINRINTRAGGGEPVDIEDIDARLTLLEISYEKIAHANEKAFQSTRDILIGMKKTRLTRAMNFTDTAEVMAEFDEKFAGHEGGADAQKAQKKGKTGDTLVDDAPEAESDARQTPMDGTQDGKYISKGKTGDTLSGSPVQASDDDFEEFTTGVVIGDAPHVENLLTMEEAAVSLATDGFKLVPNYAPTADGGCTCHKGKNCSSAGKHPILIGWDKPESENCATNDARKIRAWWRKWPNANIGIATGALGGIVVLDADFPKKGDVGLTTLLERLGLDAMPPTMEVNTGAGVHFYYKYDADDVRNSASKIEEGIDVRGAGGQVVSAPSLHRSGRRYMPANGLKPIPLPDCLRAEMLKASKKEVKPAADSNLKTSIPRAGTYATSGSKIFPDGTRNDGLRDVSCGRWLNGWAADEAELVSQMLEVNATRCAPPLSAEVVIELAQRTARNLARGEWRQEVAGV
jgi:hypothetical protein